MPRCPAEPPAPPPVVASARAAPPVLDEAAVTDKSRAFLDAIDRADIDAFRAAAGPSFGMFAAARFHDEAWFVKWMQAQRDGHEPARTSTRSSERVTTGPGVAVYVGEAVTHIPAAESHPAGEETEWDSLVWTFGDGRWTVAHWDEQQGGVEAERSMWNATFETSVNFNHKPNQLLVDTLKGRKPGAALDVAMGQGRNALYIASQGWKVTGVDISDEGIKQAKDAAAKQKLKLDAVQADIHTWDFGTARWDLVTLIYAGSRPALVEKIQRSVRKGGLVVVEFFQKEATAGTGVGGFEPGELAAEFKNGWKILRDDNVEDISDWGLHKTKLVRFVAEKQ